jgi:hypothetical protein
VSIGLIGVGVLFVASFVLLLTPLPALAPIAAVRGPVWSLLLALAAAWIPLSRWGRPAVLAWVIFVMTLLAGTGLWLTRAVS